MFRRVIILVFSAVYSVSLNAQDIASLQNDFLEAEYFFMMESYSDALPIYLSIYEKLPENSNIAFRIGACYLNIPGKKKLSVSYLQNASKNMSAHIKEGSVTQYSAPYDALFDLGKAYRLNYMFDKAIDCYRQYHKTILPDDRINHEFVQNEIRVCENAADLIARPIDFLEKNLGEKFNSQEADFNPVISADGKSFAYMTSKKFYDAVMFSRLEDNRWTRPVNITPDLLSDGDFYISCLSSDGRQLFLSKDNNHSSDIYYSTYDGNRWSKCVKLNKNINTKYWESHAFISEDESLLIFASDRPGGSGGLDLYLSRKKNGEWGFPINLGPEINTPFNEERPFLINKGKTLFFSSQGHNNIGGYDIFRSDLQPNGLWCKPVNIGYPINNPDDNLFFMPFDKGNSGYYSIFRECSGFGNEDIYKITLREN